MKPVEPMVAALVAQLDADLQEDFEERAAIVEFDANVPRPLAECLALLDVLRRHPGALLGVRALQVALQGRSYVVLAASREGVAERLGLGSQLVIREADLASVVKEQFNGLAFVTRAL